MRKMILCLLLASSVHAETLDVQLAAFRQLNAMPGAPRTYAEARQQAIARNLPLVIWSGEALCPGCVKTTTANGTWVNWVGSSPQFSALSTTSNAIIVALPENGELYHIATITQWEKLGHVASTKEAIRQFRETRAAVRQDVRRTAYQATQVYQPQMRVQSFRASAGAGC